MTLEEAQKQVDQWVKTYGVRYFSELTNMAVQPKKSENWHGLWLENMATNPSKREKKTTLMKK